MKEFSIKQLTLATLTVAAGVANAYFWKGAVFAGALQPLSLFVWPLAALFLFAVLFALSASLIQSRWLRTATAVLALASGYLVIPYTELALAATIASGIGGWLAAGAIAGEIASSRSFNVRKILKGGMPVFFTVVSLALAVFYFSAAGGTTSEALLPRALFDAAIPFLEQPLRGVLPGFRASATADEILLAVAEEQLGGKVGLLELPKAQRDELLRQGREALSRQFGITITGNERGGDILYRVASAQLARLTGPYERYLPVVAAVAFFIAIKTLTLPMYWITLSLVFLVVELLIAIGVLQRERVMVEGECVGF